MAGLGRYRGKHEITQSGGQTIEGRRIVLHVLFADSQQIKQFHDRRDAFQSQQGRVLLSPLERAHLRTRTIYRWSAAVVMALVCFAAIAVMYWPVFRSIFSGGSLYSDVLLPTGASFTQLVQSATTPWVFGSGTGIPAPPRRGCWC